MAKLITLKRDTRNENFINKLSQSIQMIILINLLSINVIYYKIIKSIIFARHACKIKEKFAPNIKKNLIQNKYHNPAINHSHKYVY